MKEYWILGIRISDRVTEVTRIQEVLTMFGCTVKTRLGLHDADGEYSHPSGTILLELAGDPEEYPKLENELRKVEGVEVRKMVFSL